MTISDERLRELELNRAVHGTEAMTMARELLALRAQVRAKDAALRCMDVCPWCRERAREALAATRTPDDGRAEPKTENDALRYHKALGATWMCEAIVSDLRAGWDDQTASYFVRKWEDRSYWDKTGPIDPDPQTRTFAQQLGAKKECIIHGPYDVFLGRCPRCESPDVSPPAEPDEAKRWLAEYVAPFMPLQRPNMAQCSSLAALVAAAREAGRGDGWDEAVEALRKKGRRR